MSAAIPVEAAPALPVRRKAAATAALVLLALPAALASPFALRAVVVRALGPGGRVDTLPWPLIYTAGIVQMLALATIFAFVGVLTAPRAGFRSAIVERVSGRVHAVAMRAIAVSAACGAILLALCLAADLVLGREYGPAWKTMFVVEPGLPALFVGIFHGGIFEELVCRWGIASALAWAGWWLLERGRPGPSPRVVAAAIGLAAVAFAALHLPVAAIGAHGAPAMYYVAAFGLNTLCGIVFGALYRRYSLEAAMVSHASFHVALFIARAALGAA